METLFIKRNDALKIGSLVSAAKTTYKIDGFALEVLAIETDISLAEWIPIHKLEPLMIYKVKLNNGISKEGYLRELKTDCRGKSSFLLIDQVWKWLLLLENQSLNDFTEWPKLPYTGLTSGDFSLESYLQKANKTNLINFPLIARGFFPKNTTDNSSYLQVDEYSYFIQPPSFIWVDLLFYLFKQLGYHLQFEGSVNDDFRNLIIPYTNQKPFKWNMKTIGFSIGELNQTGIITNIQSSGLMRFSTAGGASRAISILLPQKDKVKVSVDLEVVNNHPTNNYFCQWAFQSLVPADKIQSAAYSEDFTLEPFETYSKVWVIFEDFEALTSLEVLLISSGIASGFLDYNLKVTFEFPDSDININLNGQLPEIKALALLKRFMQTFNLTAVPDFLTKTVWLKPLDTEPALETEIPTDLNKGLFNVTDIPDRQFPKMKTLKFKEAGSSDLIDLNIPHLLGDNSNPSNPKTPYFPLTDLWDYNFGFTLLSLKGLATTGGGALNFACGENEVPILLSEIKESLLKPESLASSKNETVSNRLNGPLFTRQC